MAVVIGSGPAGVSCAAALLGRGESVLMLDAGNHAPKEDQALLERYGKGEPGASRELDERLNRVPISAKGVLLKLLFGSDFPYRGSAEHLGFDGPLKGLVPSLGLGGLSTVWGGACLPYLTQDMPDWPITGEDLAPHYQATLNRTGVTGRPDGLDAVFPRYTETFNELRISRQAQRLLNGLIREKARLNAEGIHFGQARVTLGKGLSQGAECVYCARCLNGCPHGAIYSSDRDLPELLQTSRERFKYQGGVIIEKWKEQSDGVELIGHQMSDQSPVHFQADRVYVGGGPLPTTGMALRSQERYGEEVFLADSQYFILPLLSLRGCPGVRQEKLYTLSQLFLEIQDQAVSRHTVHLQVYTYNDMMAKVMRKKLWFAPGLREIPIWLFDQRLIVIQGYVHSAESGRISVRLEKTSNGEKLKVEARPRPETRETIGRVVKKLSKAFRGLDLHPLGFGVDITQPGRGFHAGGSFPMRNQPGARETDICGRIAGEGRVHLIDSTTFPSIPATTITLTVMANAHRIGSQIL